MFLSFNFFYPLYIMNEEQIFMTSNKNYQQQKQNITIKYNIELTNWYT